MTCTIDNYDKNNILMDYSEISTLLEATETSCSSVLALSFQCAYGIITNSKGTAVLMPCGMLLP